jgi:NADP-dependent 3-hydroxy acid dehydrogenase YdfG
MMEEQLASGLKDTNVVVTGAGRGLGAALALTLSGLGCNLILCGRSLGALDTVAGHIHTRTGRYPIRVVVDLADAARVEAAAREINRSVPIIDVLINNGAAWLENRQSPYSASEVMSTVGSAITGAFLFTQALLPALRESKRPDVVTIGSVSGLPNAGLHNVAVPFYAAKHGQTALADGLRQMMLGTPVRSICIHPPWLMDISPLDPAWDNAPMRTKGEKATNRDVVDAVVVAITRPRHITIASIIIDSDSQGLDFRSHFTK